MSIGERDPDDLPVGGPDEESGAIFDGPPPAAIDIDPEDIAPPDTMEPALPALYHHCVRLYKHMYKQATRRTEGTVWEGSLLNTMTSELGLGNAHYTSITRKLKAMKCIKQLRRGGGPSPSVWLLLQEPSPGRFRVAEDIAAATPNRTIAQATRAEQAQQIRDLNQRLQKLERIALSQGWPI